MHSKQIIATESISLIQLLSHMYYQHLSMYSGYLFTCLVSVDFCLSYNIEERCDQILET